MIIYVDVDETICVTEGNKNEARDYNLARPIKENIEAINKYYEEGHEITYWTARGSGTGIDWSEVTKNQLDKWGAKYHNILFGKPRYDLYIDDKSINVKDWEGRGRCLEV